MSGENQWQRKLFGCFDNCSLCIISFVAPCYTAGKNAETLGESCLRCGLVTLAPVAGCYYGAVIRRKIREKKGIVGTFRNDFLVHCFCPGCSLVQEAREVRDFSDRARVAPAEEDGKKADGAEAPAEPAAATVQRE